MTLIRWSLALSAIGAFALGACSDNSATIGAGGGTSAGAGGTSAGAGGMSSGAGGSSSTSTSDQTGASTSSSASTTTGTGGAPPDSGGAPEITPNPNYPGNRAPLAPTPFTPLPLGVVKADGWLLTQLELQRDGATGAAESMYVELESTSPWLGGNKTNQAWGERAPYYVKGLVALAYVLDDPTLKAKAQVWLDWMLNHQGADGFLGPVQLASAGDGQNMWGRAPMLYALKDYYEATGDARVLPALTNFFHWEANNLATSPLISWARSRAGDIIDVVHWLYNRTGEASLLAHSDALRNAAYPLTAIYTNGSFFANNDFQTKHNVNVQQDIKMPAINSVRTDRDDDRNAFMAGRNHLFHQHGQIHASEAGTESLAGNSSTSGIELCSIVERMQSNEEAQMILGDPELGDQLEKLAFNALPGAITKDFHSHQYYTLPNQVQSAHGLHGYEQDHGNDLNPSPTSGYPCCRFNMHMGWPYYVKNMWAATVDSGLAIMAYGPSHLTAMVGNGANVTITESTNYPFEEQVRLTVNTGSPVAFPLKLRIPAWAQSPSVLVNETAQARRHPGFVLHDPPDLGGWRHRDHQLPNGRHDVEINQSVRRRRSRTPRVFARAPRERDGIRPGRRHRARLQAATWLLRIRARSRGTRGSTHW